MRIIINGAGGRMGQAVLRKIQERPGLEAAALVSMEFETDAAAGRYQSIGECDVPADVVIDFSHHTAAPVLASWCASRNIPAVIATTGLTEEERGAVEDAAKKIPVFYSANMSLGIALLKKLAKEAAAMFPGADIEIVEMHHRNKLDAPSGTALAIADAVKTVRTDASYVCGRSGFGKRTDSEIGIHAVRMGSEVGTHEVFFSTGNETVVLRHEAKDRGLFADGALSAAVWLAGQGPGLYGMEDLLG